MRALQPGEGGWIPALSLLCVLALSPGLAAAQAEVPGGRVQESEIQASEIAETEIAGRPPMIFGPSVATKSRLLRTTKASPSIKARVSGSGSCARRMSMTASFRSAVSARARVRRIPSASTDACGSSGDGPPCSPAVSAKITG